MPRKNKVFKPAHSKPGMYWLGYILLPYGEFYPKTRDFLEAKRGDLMRFFNGPTYRIYGVMKIKQDSICDFLCRMRYGIPWKRAFDRWLKYARMEGHGKGILSTQECLLVIYETKVEDPEQVHEQAVASGERIAGL